MAQTLPRKLEHRQIPHHPSILLFTRFEREDGGIDTYLPAPLLRIVWLRIAQSAFLSPFLPSCSCLGLDECVLGNREEGSLSPSLPPYFAELVVAVADGFLSSPSFSFHFRPVCLDRASFLAAAEAARLWVFLQSTAHRQSCSC